MLSKPGQWSDIAVSSCFDDDNASSGKEVRGASSAEKASMAMGKQPDKTVEWKNKNSKGSPSDSPTHG